MKRYVTVIIDLTPIRGGTCLACSLDMVQGHSKQAFKVWLIKRGKGRCDALEVVAMNGFAGFKTTRDEELAEATAVLGSFHFICLTGDAIDQCRHRVQREHYGHRNPGPVTPQHGPHDPARGIGPAHCRPAELSEGTIPT